MSVIENYKGRLYLRKNSTIYKHIFMSPLYILNSSHKKGQASKAAAQDACRGKYI